MQTVAPFEMLQAARKKKNLRPRKETEGKPYAVPLLLTPVRPLYADNAGLRRATRG